MAAGSVPPPTTATDSTPPPTTSEAWSLVALGDSVALAGPECDGCTSFVDLWANSVAEDAGRPVEVSNQAVPDAEASDVLDQVRQDDATRAALERADLIVIEVGLNDSPWNKLDDPCDAAPKYPVIEWSKITGGCIDRVAREYERTLDAILAEVETLRAGKPTVLRLTNVYNAVLGNHVDASWDSPAAVAPSKAANERFAEVQCRLVEEHQGECIDVYRTFNGTDGSSAAKSFLAADYTHPGPKGHEVIAELLLEAGLQPLQ
ncbi:MAG: SGNH/GDSL hydrolase family protein [Ilumatobacteraceae bacterium]